MGMPVTRALRSERRWRKVDCHIVRRAGKRATCLMLEKGQYTVDGACQGSCQSQGGASLTGAQATVWIPENQATGPGQLILGEEEVSRDGNLTPVLDRKHWETPFWLSPGFSKALL